MWGGVSGLRACIRRSFWCPLQRCSGRAYGCWSRLRVLVALFGCRCPLASPYAGGKDSCSLGPVATRVPGVVVVPGSGHVFLNNRVIAAHRGPSGLVWRGGGLVGGARRVGRSNFRERQEAAGSLNVPPTGRPGTPLTYILTCVLACICTGCGD